MNDSQSDVIGCARCGEVVCELKSASFVQHKNIGRAIVVRLASLKPKVRREEHPDLSKDFKCGKLKCGTCSQNLGNVQNNVPLEFKGTQVGMLKVVNMEFRVGGDVKSRFTITAKQLCVQLPKAAVSPIIPQLIFKCGTPISQARAPSSSEAESSAASTPLPPGHAHTRKSSSATNLSDFSSAIIVKMFRDKKGDLVGFCKLLSNDVDDARPHNSTNVHGEQAVSGDIFFFHGEPALLGFKKCGGAIDSAGLELVNGDKITELKVGSLENGKIRLKAALFVSPAGTRSNLPCVDRFAAYLKGLIGALDDADRSYSVLAALCMNTKASENIFNFIATCESLAELTIDVLERLVKASKIGPGSSTRTAKGALWAVLSSDVTLPVTPQRRGALQAVLQCSDASSESRKKLIAVLLDTWVIEENARRRTFCLLSTFVHQHPQEAMRSIKQDQWLVLLRATLPRDDELAGLSWRELPLHLLSSEMDTKLHVQDPFSGPRGDLRMVKTRGAYESFEDYMSTYVGLLREEAFASIRQGIRDLRQGKLDPRDMLVFRCVQVVAMSPPSSRGTAQGTVLELHVPAAAVSFARNALPLFGSLLVLAPSGSFDRQHLVPCVWATVAGADTVKGGGLKIHAELCAGLNDEKDSTIVTQLIKHSGQILVAESPTFYKAYAPAIATFQRMQDESMPFPQEIIEGRFDANLAVDVNASVDPSIAFSFDEGVKTSSNKALPRMPVLEFTQSLDSLSKNPGTYVQSPSSGLSFTTTLDPSQCQALKLVLERPIAVVRGPPGTGKTFTGVRSVRLLLSLAESLQGNASVPSFDSSGAVPPASVGARATTTPTPAMQQCSTVLVLTYKNIALDDFLQECVNIWPSGVARVGGKVEPGSPLAHRHINALLRSGEKRTQEHERARSEADAYRMMVEQAAQTLAERRFFSVETLLGACSCSGSGQIECISCRTSRSLLLNDPTATDQDIRAAADLLGRDKNDTDLRQRVSGLLGTWLPSKKVCSQVCRSAHVKAPAQAVSGQDRPDPEEREEEKQERSRYSDFEKAAVRLDHEPDVLSRDVLDLNGDSMSETAELELLGCGDVWELKGEERVSFMHAVVRMLFRDAEQKYNDATNRYLQVVENLRRLDVEHKASILRTMKVVGMTISGASINRDILEALKPRYVLVEESGEVLEPLLLAALGVWVERLVLIGDEKQLPPSVETHVLARDYKFNTSLMLRLINNSIPHVQLSYQARMMPQFATLLLDVYPDYKTSDRVLKAQRESPPPGATHAMWWWDVRGDGQEDETCRSRVNVKEANAVTALVVHFVRCGIKPKRITVLAPYAGQVEHLRKVLNKELHGVARHSAWPKPREHGAAALRALQTLQASDTTTVRDCLSLCDTFLKLGQLPESDRVLQVAHKKLREASGSTAQLNAGTNAPAGEGGSGANLSSVTGHEADGAAQVDVYRRRLSELANLQDGLQSYLNGRSSTNDAINVLMEADSMCKKWQATSVAFTAASCHLCIEVAQQLLVSPNWPSPQPNQLSPQLKRLVEAKKSNAEKQLCGLEAQENVCVCSIDRYQGSENDIVIVSLVRSNGKGDVGFLRDRARRVVAQSRARLLMYFVGDRKTFDTVDHWRSLTTSMQAQKCVGEKIYLCCPKHKKDFVLSYHDDELKRFVKQGLCEKECGDLMACGKHRCKSRCHGDCNSDLHLQCMEPVTDFCEHGHFVQRKCFEAVSDKLCLACEKIAAAELERERKAREEAHKEMERRLAEDILRLSTLPPEPKFQTLSRSGSSCAEFLRVQDRTEKYVQAQHGRQISVTKIVKVFNPKLEMEFIRSRTRLKSGHMDVECNLQQLFHGTGPEGVQGIPRTGFRLPEPTDKNMFGRGVYFATDSSKSAQEMYTKGSGCLILCDVLLGKACEVAGLSSNHDFKSFVMTSSSKRPYLDVDLEKVRSKGYDSVFAPRDTRNNHGVQFDEMIIYDPQAAIPRYIVHFGVFGVGSSEWRILPNNLSPTVKVYEIREGDLGSGESKELHEFNFAAGQYLRLLGTHAQKVTRVEKYESPLVQDAFARKTNEFRNAGKMSGGKDDIVWVFHGTQPGNLKSICADGFKVGGRGVDVRNGAAHGPGVYTATGPGTPMGYSGPGNGVILAMGLKGRHGHRHDQDCDTWSPCGDWMIFRTAEQLLPVYVVHFNPTDP